MLHTAGRDGVEVGQTTYVQKPVFYVVTEVLHCFTESLPCFRSLPHLLRR